MANQEVPKKLDSLIEQLGAAHREAGIANTDFVEEAVRAYLSENPMPKIKSNRQVKQFTKQATAIYQERLRSQNELPEQFTQLIKNLRSVYSEAGIDGNVLIQEAASAYLQEHPHFKPNRDAVLHAIKETPGNLDSEKAEPVPKDETSKTARYQQKEPYRFRKRLSTILNQWKERFRRFWNKRAMRSENFPSTVNEQNMSSEQERPGYEPTSPNYEKPISPIQKAEPVPKEHVPTEKQEQSANLPSKLEKLLRMEADAFRNAGIGYHASQAIVEKSVTAYFRAHAEEQPQIEERQKLLETADDIYRTQLRQIDKVPAAEKAEAETKPTEINHEKQPHQQINQDTEPETPDAAHQAVTTLGSANPKIVEQAAEYYAQHYAIDKDIFQECADRGLLYGNSNDSVVFVNRDQQGHLTSGAVYAVNQDGKQTRKMLPGSEPGSGWAVDHGAASLYVTDTPLDALSVMTMQKLDGKSVENTDFLAADSADNSVPIKRYLLSHPQISEITIGYENSPQGQERAMKTYIMLKKDFPQLSDHILKGEYGQSKAANMNELLKEGKTRSKENTINQKQRGKSPLQKEEAQMPAM